MSQQYAKPVLESLFGPCFLLRGVGHKLHAKFLSIIIISGNSEGHRSTVYLGGRSKKTSVHA